MYNKKGSEIINKKIIVAIVVAAIIVVAGVTYYFIYAPSAPETKAFRIAQIFYTPGYTPWDVVLREGLKEAARTFNTTERPIYIDAVYNLDPVDFKRVAKVYIEEGYDLISGEDGGYGEDLRALADEYPDMNFFHILGYIPPDPTELLRPNLQYWPWDIWKGYYVAGIIAGSMTETNLIGHVGSFDFPGNAMIVNMMMAGVHRVNPDAKLKYVFTGSWSDPVKAASGARTLADLGCDVLFPVGGANPEATMREVEKDGIWCIGYYIDQHYVSPSIVLTSVEVNAVPYYTLALQDIFEGTFGGGIYELSAEQITRLSPYYELESVIPKSARDLVVQVNKELSEGTFTLPEVPTTMPPQ